MTLCSAVVQDNVIKDIMEAKLGSLHFHGSLFVFPFIIRWCYHGNRIPNVHNECTKRQLLWCQCTRNRASHSVCFLTETGRHSKWTYPRFHHVKLPEGQWLCELYRRQENGPEDREEVLWVNTNTGFKVNGFVLHDWPIEMSKGPLVIWDTCHCSCSTWIH